MLMLLLWQIKCRKQSYLEWLLSQLLVSRVSVSQQQDLVSCQILKLYHLVSSILFPIFTCFATPIAGLSICLFITTLTFW